MKHPGVVILLWLSSFYTSYGQTTRQLIDSARFYKNRDYSKVIFFSNAAYVKAKASKQDAVAGESAFLLGMGNYLAGNYDKALIWYFESERVYTKAKDTSGLAELYSDMCVFYVKIKKFDEADKVSKRAILYSLAIKNPGIMATAINNRGLMFLDKGMNDSAMRSFQSSYNIYKKTKDKTGMAYSLDFLSSVEAEKGLYKDAFEAMNKSRQLREGLGDKTGEAITINNIGELYLKEKKPHEAESYFLEAIARAHELKYADLETYGYNMLSQTYRQQGNYEKAYKAQSEYLRLDQKFQEEKHTRAIEELQTKYETNKKEQQNKLLKEQNNAQQIKLSRNRIGLYALLSIMILLTILFYLLYNKYKLKQEARFNEAMAEEHRLRAQGIIDAEENERQRLARELHDGVGQLLSAARRKIQSLQTDTVGDHDEPLKMLDDSIREVRDISHSMMPPSILNKNLKQAIEEFIERINHEGSLIVSIDWVNMDDLELDKTTTLMLYRSLQEMITNIFRHAKASTIHIELINHNAELTLMVYDNGIGFDKEKITQTSQGIGLKNIRSRVAYINGSLEIDTMPGKGVTYIIELPLLNVS